MRFFLPLILVVLVACNNNSSLEKPDVAKPTNDTDKASYTLGYNIAQNLKQNKMDLNEKYVVRGLMDAFADDTTEALSLLTKEEKVESSKYIDEQFQKKQKEAQEESTKKFREQGSKFKVEGEKYLAENAKKEGVVTLPSGIQYKILKKGTGKMPSGKSLVRMHIVSKFTDGTLFDDTHVEGRGPVDLPLDQVMKGWSMIVPLMPIGSTWEISVPYQLGYGDAGFQNVIPPYATLVFEMELLDILQ